MLVTRSFAKRRSAMGNIAPATIPARDRCSAKTAEIRLQLLQPLLIQRVQAAVPAESGRDRVVDLSAGQPLAVDAARRQHRLVPHLRRIIAFMRHAHQRIGKAEGTDDLGRARQQRDDSQHRPPDRSVVRWGVP